MPGHITIKQSSLLEAFTHPAAADEKYSCFEIHIYRLTLYQRQPRVNTIRLRQHHTVPSSHSQRRSLPKILTFPSEGVADTYAISISRRAYTYFQASWAIYYLRRIPKTLDMPRRFNYLAVSASYSDIYRASPFSECCRDVISLDI